MSVGCTMSKHYLKQGNYDMATREAARKLQKNRNKEKHIMVLEEAYPKAQKNDEDRILFLHKQGEPDRWDEIFKIYSNMELRQVLVENVTPLYLEGRKIEFAHVDYDEKIIEAKIKAADYYYAHSKQLLESGNKFSNRQAYEELLKVKEYTKSYSDVDNLLQQAYTNGLSNVILVAVNSTPFKLPEDFMINLINFPVGDLNSFWINYYALDTKDVNYDVAVNVVLTIADVSPNNMSSNEFTERKEVKDGWEYKLDSNGNFVLDSAGNKIKVPKYKTISCNVSEVRQFKIAHIEGAVNYVDIASGQIILSVPIAADHFFEHYYYKADGDLDALSNETRAKIKSMPIAYPNDFEMIYAANQTIKDLIYQVLMENRPFLISRY